MEKVPLEDEQQPLDFLGVIFGCLSRLRSLYFFYFHFLLRQGIKINIFSLIILLYIKSIPIAYISHTWVNTKKNKSDQLQIATLATNYPKLFI